MARPCIHCAKILAASGIKKIYYYNDYKNMALKISNNKDYLNKIKSRLKKERITSCLFNTKQYTKDLEDIYVTYVRSILEQSCVVWNSSLTQENIQDLERVQKAAVRVMLGQKYTNYEDGLEQLNLKKLSERRNELCLR